MRLTALKSVYPNLGLGNYVGDMLNVARSASVRAIENLTLTGYTVMAFRRQFPGAAPESRNSRQSEVSAPFGSTVLSCLDPDAAPIAMWPKALLFTTQGGFESRWGCSPLANSLR